MYFERYRKIRKKKLMFLIGETSYTSENALDITKSDKSGCVKIKGVSYRLSKKAACYLGAFEDSLNKGYSAREAFLWAFFSKECQI